MKKVWSKFMPALLLLAVPLSALAGGATPVVSASWLDRNLGNPKLVAVDIRKVEEFRQGHVPGSVNVFYGAWAVKRDNLDNQIPVEEELSDVLAGAGISGESLVVLIGKTDTLTDLANLTRVAWTLGYAGIEDVAILDGGFNQWLAEKKSVSADLVKSKQVADSPIQWNRGILASKEDVVKVSGKATLVDTRNPEYFFGVEKLPFVERAGHATGAVSLPTAWIFSKGLFRPSAELEATAKNVIGADKNAPVIVYCDTGRLASGWWFVLTRVLGYRNVQLYDGSAQEWAKDHSLAMNALTWK